jgi:hypothetical protein
MTPQSNEKQVARFMSNDANLVMCVRAEDFDGLLAQLRKHEKWLSERVDWLKYEMDHGGDWKYLNLKREETAYCIEKLRAHIPALDVSEKNHGS